jgi:hypothetical protein
MQAPDRKVRNACALIGFGVAAALVVYQVLFDHPSLSHVDTVVLIFGFVVCPPSLLSVPIFIVLFEAAETGTPLFYFIWFFIGLFNAALYSAVGPLVVEKIKRTKVTDPSRA